MRRINMRELCSLSYDPVISNFSITTSIVRLEGPLPLVGAHSARGRGHYPAAATQELVILEGHGNKTIATRHIFTDLHNVLK